MNIGLLIIGDEILSGRRCDKHLPKMIEILQARGLTLSWARIASDDPALLVRTYRESFEESRKHNTIVFSTGGIGGTPDDLTREAVAKALDSSTERHPEGVKILEEFVKQFDRKLTEERYRMVTFPKGSSLIPNPINTIPGFSIKRHHFVPGFPEMAHPMIEWVLDNIYPELANSQYTEQALMLFDTYESRIIPLMESLLQQWPQVKIFSLPIINQPTPQIELGAKGQTAEVKEVMSAMKRQLKELGVRWERI